MWRTGPRRGTKPQFWAVQPIFHARPDSLILSSLKPSSSCFCLLPTPTQSRRRPRRRHRPPHPRALRRRRPSPPSPAGPPRAAPMSSSAAALAWRRSLRDALLRGSAWRGAPAANSAAARLASTASASEAAAGPKKVPPPPRKVREPFLFLISPRHLRIHLTCVALTELCGAAFAQQELGNATCGGSITYESVDGILRITLVPFADGDAADARLNGVDLFYTSIPSERTASFHRDNFFVSFCTTHVCIPSGHVDIMKL